MANVENKEVLLRISNLKQYFPIKKGRVVKANDGISIDIYKGETFGLVGESGCGKSTLGRTILQLYHQTYGRTMYYGRSLDDLAPKYMLDTIKKLPKLRSQWKELEAKKAELEAAYEKLTEEEQYAKHAELDQARKLAEDAMLNMTKIVGGFVTVENLAPVQAVYEKVYNLSKQISNLDEKLQDAQVNYDDAVYTLSKGKGSQSKVDSCKAKVETVEKQIADLRAQLEQVRVEIDAMRQPLVNDPEFQKYEAFRDDGIDLARLDYNEMRRLRRDM